MYQEKPKTKAYHKNQGKKGDSKIKSVSFEPKDDSVIVKDKGGEVDVYDPFDEDHIISEINKSIAVNHPEDERTVVQEQLYEYEFNPSGNSGKYVNNMNNLFVILNIKVIAHNVIYKHRVIFAKA